MEAPLWLDFKLWRLILVLFTIPDLCVAQIKSFGSISGSILDDQTREPVPGAIIYLEGTSFGNSSSVDGSFHISAIPPGNYQLVISHIGYDHKTIPISIASSDSVWYRIRLQPRLIRTKEIEVTATRQKVEDQFTLGDIFTPQDAPDSYTYSGVGYKRPLGVFWTDEAIYMFSMDTAIVEGEKYLKLWFLFYNKAETAHDYDPLKEIRVSVNGRQYSYPDISPDPSASVAERLSVETLKQEIIDRIGKELLAGSKLFTWFETDLNHHFHGRGRYTHGFRQGIKEFSLDWGESRSLANPISAYSVLTSCANEGILRRHIVDSQNGIHGYVYFAFPGLRWNVEESPFKEIKQYQYVITITTATGEKSIAFGPR